MLEWTHLFNKSYEGFHEDCVADDNDNDDDDDDDCHNSVPERVPERVFFAW